MHVEVRVELRSRKWKEVLRLWEEEVESDVQLSGLLGSIVGIFREDSDDFSSLEKFMARHQEPLDIRMSMSRRAVYSRDEKRGFELLVVFLETIFDASSLSTYELRDRCPQCGKVPPPIRKGRLILAGSEYKSHAVFLTEANEVVVDSSVREAMKSAGLSGVDFGACYSPEGAVLSGYAELVTRSRLGPRLTREGVPLVCRCGRWSSESQSYPPEFIYARSQWDRSDVVFTGDHPPLFGGSPELVDVLSRYEDTVGWDQCLPIHLV